MSRRNVVSAAFCFGALLGTSLLLWVPPSVAQIFGIERRVGGAQCVPLYYGDDAYYNVADATNDGLYYDDGSGGTGYATCPSAEHLSSTVNAYSADLKYQDNSSTRCLSCFWYLKTHNGSTYYSSFRYSDGGSGASCTSSFTGRGTMTWSLGWGPVTNVAQLNAYCVVPSAGGTQHIRSYRVTTDLPPL